MVHRQRIQPGTDWLQFPRHRIHFLTNHPDPFLEIESADTEKFFIPFVNIVP